MKREVSENNFTGYTMKKLPAMAAFFIPVVKYFSQQLFIRNSRTM